nr:hypothetical protein [Verminephrobacter aporrectodeae]
MGYQRDQEQGFRGHGSGRQHLWYCCGRQHQWSGRSRHDLRG